MNSFFSKIKAASSDLIDAANQKIPSLPSLPYQFTLSESKLNLAIKLALPTGGDLKSVVLTLQPGFADAVLQINHKIGPIEVRLAFEIESFEISGTVQQVVLRRRGEVQAVAEGFLRQAVLAVVGGILSLVFGKTLLDLGLKNQEGVTVNGERVTVDLSRLGLQEKIKDALLARVGGSLSGWAGTVAGGKALELMMDKLADKLAITSAVFQPQELALTIDRSAAKT